jgi:GNAT superfamily N-acetyltransferase
MTNPARLPKGYEIASMTRPEAAILESWAADEGWNPGLNDMDVAWETDAGAFVALRKDGELAGGGTIIAYDGKAGFMGLFIMRKDLRRQGLGQILWRERLRRLQKRLQPNAPIGMDGVFDMVPFYAAGGFRLLYRDLRYEGKASGTRDPDAIPLAQVPWAELAAYDLAVSGIERPDFMRRWLAQAGGEGFAWKHDGGIAGYGFRRRCRSGFKIGPLYAENADIARRLLESLLSTVPEAPVALDVPEPNKTAVALAEDRGWTQSFGCARMLYGPQSAPPTDRIFGVTSFEFG